MKSFGKKLVAGALVASIALSGLGFMSSPAIAANTTDWNFTFPLDTYTRYGTSARRKENATPLYLYIEKMDAKAVNFYTDGSNSSDVNKGTWINETVGSVAVARSTGKYSVHNNVYEHGKAYVRLTATRNVGAGKTSGKWSPDSMYKYTSLN